MLDFGSGIRKMEKERDIAKASCTKEKNETSEPVFFTLNIKFNNSMFPVRVLSTSTMKGVRVALRSSYPATFTSEKMTKKNYFEYLSQDLSNHSRREVGSGSSGKTGWKMNDGAVIHGSIGGKGGAKRTQGLRPKEGVPVAKKATPRTVPTWATVTRPKS